MPMPRDKFQELYDAFVCRDYQGADPNELRNDVADLLEALRKQLLMVSRVHVETYHASEV